jgi:Tfp pilus assembly protein PilN
MRDLEFLPRWYPVLTFRRRLVRAQAWGIGVVAFALAIWALLGHRQNLMAQRTVDNVQTQLVATGVDLQRLSDVENFKKELEHQDQIVRALGIHVPASRMLSSLAQLMPPEMALVSLSVHTEEEPAVLTDLDRARGLTPQLQRRLDLHMVGLAPTDEELATFMTRLVGVPYFSQVALVKTEDFHEKGHVMRRFEVTFALDLTADEPAAVANNQD